MMREHTILRMERNFVTVLVTALTTALIAVFVVASFGGSVFATEARPTPLSSNIAGASSDGTTSAESDSAESAETESASAGSVATIKVPPPVRSGIGAFGTEATNPAVIGLGEPVFRLRMAPFTATVGNDAWALTTLDHWVDKYIPRDDRKQLLADIPDDGLGLHMNTSHGAVLGIGSFSAHVGVRSIYMGNLAPDVFELLFLGNKLNERYTVDSSMGAVAFGDASVGLGLRVGSRIRIGARYHQLLEALYGEQTIKAKGEFVHTDEEIDLDTAVEMGLTVMHPREGSGAGVGAGAGSAFDVGAVVQLSDNLSVGVAVLDIGRIEWSSVASSKCTIQLDDFDESTDGDDCTLERRDEQFRWNLPRRYEISAGWQLPWGFHLGTAYTLTTHPKSDGFSIKNHGELGAMLVWERFKFMQLGVGTTYGKAAGLSVNAGAGFRLGPLQTRAHISDVLVLFGKGTAKGFGLGADLGFVF